MNDNKYHFTIVWNDGESTKNNACESDTMDHKQDAIDAAISIMRTLKKSHKHIAYGFILSDKQMNNNWVFDQKMAIAVGNKGKVSCFVAPEAPWATQHVDVILGI